MLRYFLNQPQSPFALFKQGLHGYRIIRKSDNQIVQPYSIFKESNWKNILEELKSGINKEYRLEEKSNVYRQ